MFEVSDVWPSTALRTEGGKAYFNSNIELKGIARQVGVTYSSLVIMENWPARIMKKYKETRHFEFCYSSVDACSFSSSSSATSMKGHWPFLFCSFICLGFTQN